MRVEISPKEARFYGFVTALILAALLLVWLSNA